MSEKVIDRIRKLFALASQNSNEAEATAALEKARALMHEHNISNDALDRDAGPRRGELMTAKQWQIDCFRAAARIYGAVIVEDRDDDTKFIIVGRDDIREAVEATGDYLVNEVEKWYKVQLKKQEGRTQKWRQAFRRDFKEAAAFNLIVRAIEMSSRDLPQPSTSTALTIVEATEQLTKEAMDFLTSRPGNDIQTVRGSNPLRRMSPGTYEGMMASEAIPLKSEVTSASRDGER